MKWGMGDRSPFPKPGLKDRERHQYEAKIKKTGKIQNRGWLGLRWRDRVGLMWGMGDRSPFPKPGLKDRERHWYEAKKTRETLG